MSERQLVNLFESALALIREPKNEELGRRFDFNLSEVIPKELSNSEIIKVARFFKYRMTEHSKSDDRGISKPEKPASRLPDWSLESMINPAELDKSRGKSKEPEIEI